MSLIRSTLAVLATLTAAVPAAAQSPAEPDTIPWRAFDRETFEEARDTGKSVFLLLTAPWNRDHFLLRSRYLSDPEVVRRLRADYLPIHADVSVWPELHELYSLGSGLVPSFHFLDAGGREYGAFPPLDPEEFSYYLGEMADLSDTPPTPPRADHVPVAVNDAKLASRIARILVDRFAAGEAPTTPVHRDLDPSALSFLLEFGVTRPGRRDVHQTIDSELRRLLASELFDDVGGGFHRAAASADLGAVHREKLLRPNAELGAVLASWYRMTDEEAFGAAALQTLLFFNRHLKRLDPTLYGGSMAADVYSPRRDEIQMTGEQYYRLNAAMRSRVGAPPVSRKIPVGANFVLQQSMIGYLRAFGDGRMTQPARWSGDYLLAGGLEPSGLAVRSTGTEGTGCLRDQGDAGSGLLAVHAIAGNRPALEAAVRLAEALVDRFWDDEEKVFRNVDRKGPLPDFVRDAEPVAAWNGTTLRFLAELAAVTGEARWRELVEESLAAWAARLPIEDRAIGELGRAALRVERPVPVLLLVADPESDRGAELRDIALRLYDPLVLVRWIPPGDRDAARAFDIDPDDDPAIRLLWDRLSRPIRDPVLLRAVYEDARERVRP